jgi:CBS domain-containing protein
MTAYDLMTGQPAVIAGSDTVAAAAALMRTRGVGMLPVVKDLESMLLIGILTDRDIVVRHVALGHGAEAKVHEHMSRSPLVTVSADASVAVIADRMTKYQVRRLPVIDSRGAVIGVIAQADLATAVGPTDPQLVERVVEAISRPGALVH